MHTTITFTPREHLGFKHYTFDLNGRQHTTPTCGVGVVDPGREFKYYFLPDLIDLLGIEPGANVRHIGDAFTLTTALSETQLEANLKTVAANYQGCIQDLCILDDDGFLDQQQIDAYANELNLHDGCQLSQGLVVWHDDYGRPYQPTVYDILSVILEYLDTEERMSPLYT